MKIADPNFNYFIIYVPYLQRMRKMVVNHVEIITKMPEGPIGEEESINLDNPKLNVTLEIEEDDSVEASWVTKGNKR